MRIAIVGGCGRTGRLLAKNAVTAGHSVRITDRDDSRSGGGQSDHDVRQGNLLDTRTITDFVRGVDAVVCILGAPLKEPGTMMSRGTDCLVQAMGMAGVRRLVLVSSDGVGETRDGMPLMLRVGAILFRKFMAEKEAQERIVRASALEWTIVRPGRLTDGPWTGQVVTSRNGDGRSKDHVSRADLLAFLLTQLIEPSSIGRSPQLFTKVSFR